MSRSPRALNFTLAVVWAGLGCDLAKLPPAVQLESVAEAPEHFEARRLSFTGTPRPEFMGEERWRNPPSSRGTSGSGRELAMFVVPVVPAEWTPEDPVPLWVSPPSNSTQVDDWLARLPEIEAARAEGKVMDYAARAPGVRTQSGWQRAVLDAEARHGIRSDPHAPIVHWPEKR